uniref:Carboxylic ester hydrolase n=1 Tax=Strigamia maritima TaxID=126957 RepID=T1IP85_STRMM
MSALWMLAIAGLLTTFLSPTLESKQEPRVQITQGHIQGSMLSSVKGRLYFAFKGVPYAQPPVGENRFTPPQPPNPWQGTLLATKCGASCPQLDFDNDGAYTGDEDCLFLNIYTPVLDEDNLKPVMLFIHGGAFNYGSGSADSYGGGRFMDYDVVLVTFNYRLSVLGFLNVDEEFAPGNVGLLDQVKALEWVNKNIRFFGGDPNKVTLFGQSAGSASVIYHLISPLSKGLFHRAIAQSGSPLCKWAHQENPLYWATRLAADMKCPVVPSNEMIECLRRKPAKTLILNTVKYQEFSAWPMPFVPSNQHVESENNFLSHNPTYILLNGEINNVSVITGVTKDEGVALYLSFLQSGALKRDNFEDGIAKFLSTTLQVRDKDQLNIAQEAIRKEYLEGTNMEDEVEFRSTKIEIISDGMNKACGLKTAEILASRNIQTYFYSLEHRLNKSITRSQGMLGVAHGDDLIFLFEGPSLDSEPLFPEDDRVSQKMLQIWTRFANHGVPDKDMEWQTVGNEDKMSCIRITNTLSPSKILKTKKMKLWNDLINKIQSSFSVKTEL